jgi:hypothetical protein
MLPTLAEPRRHLPALEAGHAEADQGAGEEGEAGKYEPQDEKMG